MNLCECRYTCKCSIIAVIVSIALGVVAAFLNFSMNLAVTTLLLWVFFGTVLAFLAFSLLTAPFLRKRDVAGCLCSSLITFLTGIFGTVLLSLVLLFVDIATAGITGSVLVGLLFASFFLTLTSAVCMVKELFGCEK